MQRKSSAQGVDSPWEQHKDYPEWLASFPFRIRNPIDSGWVYVRNKRELDDYLKAQNDSCLLCIQEYNAERNRWE